MSAQTISTETNMLHTTLRILRQNGACAPGYRTLIASLPKGHADGAPITLLHILESNGIKDATWALRATIEPTGKAVAVAEGYAMVRRPRAMPYVAPIKELRFLSVADGAQS